MTRTYSNLCNEDVKVWLETLADKSVNSEKYKEIMTKIGMSLGDCVLAQIDDYLSDVYLACTVEDADFLAKGMLIRLEKQIQKVAFACFWNQRFSPFEIEDLKVAPILKKYQEPSNNQVKYLIVVKSIISGACVVRTNLINLIQKIEPEKIFIVAPVIYHNAEQKLKNEFEEPIYDKFQFFYFAKDDKRTSEGEVIPGIGGNVYLRLGFEGQNNKNEYIPTIVKLRRSKFIHRSKSSTFTEL
ncbi:hypothetical protein [Brasilonema sp. UFV-L1]|uniref:hypothetical protein n=1 Tax=Brasilonema sp. UFV-L1 TaxID=2234130 RepID=UPI00145F76FE|nr:hypothetical protein [Brasilonema sp. UFV-L1]NMG10700.1 hypothetical protein [Brasilonema sp. UFV-L1]